MCACQSARFKAWVTKAAFVLLPELAIYIHYKLCMYCM